MRHAMLRWLVIAATLTLGGTAPALAEEDHSHSAQDDPLAGATVEMLAGGEPATSPGQALVLLQITLEPGTEIAPHGHPGAVTVLVREGIFGTAFVEGEGTITRAGRDPDGPTEEVASAGGDYVLETGDTLFYQDARHTMVNAGDEPLVLLVAALLDSDEPGFVFDDASAHQD